MEKKRHAKSYARENAFKSLYSYSISKDKEAIEKRSDLEKERKDELANQMAYNTISHLEEIDKIIKKNLVRWSIHNLNIADLSILRLAIYELEYEQTPAGIVINESLNLVDRYSDPKSKKFIHKVLDNVTK